MKYKFLEHTADVKFRSYGRSMEKAFENSALALKETMTEGLDIKNKEKKRFMVKGGDKEALLREFLEEFLYLLDAENFLVSKMKSLDIKKNKEYKLKVVIKGDKASNYQFSNPVKAVTYNEMMVKKQKIDSEKDNKGQAWMCQVVLDV